MIFLTAALCVICVVLLMIIISFQRQINDICRRLDFIKSNETNMRLRSVTQFRKLNILIDSINGLIDKTDDGCISAKKENEALKDSITGISHDIRTPLTSLSGYFQLFSDTENAEERKRYSDIINDRIYDLKYMLDELFTYTKLQNDEYTLELERIDFTKCVINSMLAFYQQFSDRGIEPETDIDDTPVFIIGNNEAVTRILQNILKNALVHGSDHIGITLRRVGERIVFICSNNCGSPDEIDIDSVFRKFYKADPARRESSTGIGLTVAYKLVQKINGHISAELNGDVFSIKTEFDVC